MGVIGDYEIITAMCPDCGKVMRMSFKIGEAARFTWCIPCGHAVLWEKV